VRQTRCVHASARRRLLTVYGAAVHIIYIYTFNIAVFVESYSRSSAQIDFIGIYFIV